MVAPNVIHAKQGNTPLELLVSYALQVSSVAKEFRRARSVILVQFRQLMVAPIVIHVTQENTPLELLVSYALQVSSVAKEFRRA